MSTIRPRDRAPVAPLHSAGVANGVLAFLPDRERERLPRDREVTARIPNSTRSLDALVAELAEARERGFALDAEENEPGIHCVGPQYSTWSNSGIGLPRPERGTALRRLPAV